MFSRSFMTKKTISVIMILQELLISNACANVLDSQNQMQQLPTQVQNTLLEKLAPPSQFAQQIVDRTDTRLILPAVGSVSGPLSHSFPSKWGQSQASVDVEPSRGNSHSHRSSRLSPRYVSVQKHENGFIKHEDADQKKKNAVVSISSFSKSPLFGALIQYFSKLRQVIAKHVQKTKSTRPISQDLFDRGKLMSQYSATAYCFKPDGENSSPIVCPPGICDDVHKNRAAIFYPGIVSRPLDVAGFVAVDPKVKMIVVSMRGTTSMATSIQNLKLWMIKSDLCEGCSIHTGFNTLFQNVRAKMRAGLEKTIAKYPGYHVVFTGHSLGGALATLLSSYTIKEGIVSNSSLYTYGSPMVGNSKFANFASQNIHHIYRFVHRSDAFTRLPLAFVGYRHIGTEIHMANKNKVAPRLADVTIKSSKTALLRRMPDAETLLNDHADDPDSNPKLTTQPTVPIKKPSQMFSLEDHLWYFNAISGCQSINFG